MKVAAALQLLCVLGALLRPGLPQEPPVDDAEGPKVKFTGLIQNL
jgi:hypothetical protein